MSDEARSGRIAGSVVNFPLYNVAGAGSPPGTALPPIEWAPTDAPTDESVGSAILLITGVYTSGAGGRSEPLASVPETNRKIKFFIIMTIVDNVSENCAKMKISMESARTKSEPDVIVGLTTLPFRAKTIRSGRS